MASNIIIIFTLIISSLLTIQTKGEFVRTVDRELHEEVHKEKKTFLHFYFHEIHKGPNATSVGIVNPPLNTSTFFGFLDMIDNPLTEGPDMNSTLIGRAQGFFGSASLEYEGILFVMNLVFLRDKYNGSYLTVVGRNKIFDQVRELPVVGGSWVFRLARGYVLVTPPPED